MKIFNKDNLPEETKFSLFRKKHLTKAIRIEGPFKVETTEGPLDCQDGWLAVDSRGFPYPIADDEFQNIYERIEK